MSGGYFNYSNDTAAREIFGYGPAITYGLEDLQGEAKLVAKDNPLEDHEISELVYDVFCLLHSYDWYKESDTGYETYRKDVVFFKDKWLRSDPSERMNRLIDQAIERIKDVAHKEIEELKNEAQDTLVGPRI